MTLESLSFPRASAAVLAGLLLLPGALRAQDTTRTPEGVRVGIEYRPGVRPSVVVLPGAGLDSVRAILARDLDFSDRFDVIPLAAQDSGAVAAAPGGPALNYSLFRTLGAAYAVEAVADGPGVTLRLHDITAGAIRRDQRFVFPPVFDVGFRLAVHRASDEVVRWISGTPGAAASQLLFLIDRRLYRVDSDGAAVAAI